MKKIVVLTGAGISAESGLKAFRDSGGLWEEYKIEEVATPDAWEKDQNAKGKVTLLADGNGDFSEKIGLSFDGSKFGLGIRGQRFAMIIDNCIITHLAVEESGAFEVSNVESMLEQLKKK